jgi:hypothetical protein
MGRTRLIALLVTSAIGVGACAALTPRVPSMPMDAALQQARAAARPSLADWIRAGLQAPGTFGITHTAAPVVVPPDIRRVWIPTHENSDGELVAGHWVYLRIRDFRWFLETPGSTGAESGQTPVGSPGATPAPNAGARATGVPWVEVPAPGSSSPAGPVPGASETGRPSGIAAPRPAPTTPR